EGTPRPVIDKVKGRPAGAHPGFALLIGKDVDGRVKRSLLRPRAFALVEHALAHDVGADALRGAANQVIDRAGLSPRSELEVLAEVLLVDEPAHQRAPLGTPVLVPGVLHGHAIRRQVAVEAQSDVDEYLAHGFPLGCLAVGRPTAVSSLARFGEGRTPRKQ